MLWLVYSTNSATYHSESVLISSRTNLTTVHLWKLAFEASPCFTISSFVSCQRTCYRVESMVSASLADKASADLFVQHHLQFFCSCVFAIGWQSMTDDVDVHWSGRYSLKYQVPQTTVKQVHHQPPLYAGWGWGHTKCPNAVLGR